MKRLLLFSLLLSFWAGTNAQNCLQCGTGTDGPYLATGAVTLTGGTYNFTTFTIDPGAVVTVTGNQPLIIMATGDVNINGMLVANGANGTDGVTYVSGGLGGQGVAGGGNGGDGVFSSPSGPLDGMPGAGDGPGANGAGWSGGGGAGHAAAGGSSGGVGGLGGPLYGTSTLQPTAYPGSGGGGGSGGYDCGAGGGGGGGGYINIQTCGNFSIGATSLITANGGSGGSDGTGNCGGGGGGSGGTIWFGAMGSFTNNGGVVAIGGAGGASNVPGNPYYGTGGNGADGRIRFDCFSYQGTGVTLPAQFYTALPIAFSVSTSMVPASCFGGNDGEVHLSVTGSPGPFTFTWLPNVSNDSTATGLYSGLYTVTVSDGNCNVTDSVLVSQPPALTGSANVTQPFCAGDSGSITATAFGGTPAYSYLWTPGNISGNILNNVPAGLYTITITDSEGCDTNYTYQVVSPPAVAVSLTGTNETAPGAGDGTVTSTASGGNAPYTYLWNNGQTTASISGLAGGLYFVTVTDSNGCSITDSITIAVDGLGIDSENPAHFSVFPNPAKDQVVFLNGNFEGEFVIKLINMAGEEIIMQQIVTEKTSQLSLNLGDVASGIYMLRVSNSQWTHTERISIIAN